jgi:hypothetical protein
VLAIAADQALELSGAVSLAKSLESVTSMHIEPNDLAIFLAIARHRSFRKAVDEIGVTPSALNL